MKTLTSYSCSLSTVTVFYMRLFRQVYINRVEIIEVNDLRTLGGIIHSLNGTLSPTLNRCDKLTADHQLVRYSNSKCHCFVV